MSIAEKIRGGATLPTDLDLPDTDNKPVDNLYQPEQSNLLTNALYPHLERLNPDGPFYVASNNGIYWDLKPELLDGCRAPDWFYVEGVSSTIDGRLKRSYVLWQEHVPPTIVIELVSGDGSEEHDATPESGKFWVYEQAIKAKYYVIYEPYEPSLEVFRRTRNRYRRMKPDDRGRYRIPEMQLEFGIWDGTHHGHRENWLRAWDLNGKLIPTPEELAAYQTKRTASEKQRAESEKQRAEKLAAKLRELGIDPGSI